jgi:hypothetical protein
MVAAVSKGSRLNFGGFMNESSSTSSGWQAHKQVQVRKLYVYYVICVLGFENDAGGLQTQVCVFPNGCA